MEKSESVKELASALSKAQAVMVAAKKENNNPFFKSKYADLHSITEAIKEPLATNNLSYVQGMDVDESGGVIVETMLMHSSGEWVCSRLRMKPVKDDPQGIGSCITYARRYGLQAIVGIPTDDDDGNAASGKSIEKVQEERSSLAETEILLAQVLEHIKEVDNTPRLDNYEAVLNGALNTAKAKAHAHYNVLSKFDSAQLKKVTANFAQRRAEIKTGLKNKVTEADLKKMYDLAEGKGKFLSDIEQKCFENFNHKNLDHLERHEYESLLDWINSL